MASRKRSAGRQRKVAHFPPIPRLPKAPSFPADPRQVATLRIIDNIGRVARPHMQLSGPNTSTGFHASAVNAGLLQTTLENGLARFTDDQLKERWDEIFDWLRRVLRSWVQRCKRMRIERREAGIRIELETQDDLGYYEYRFDVFPRRTPWRS